MELTIYGRPSIWNCELYFIGITGAPFSDCDIAYTIGISKEFFQETLITKFNGVHYPNYNDDVVFKNRSDADKALIWAESTLLAYKLAQ